jgi:hypothetical protein
MIKLGVNTAGKVVITKQTTPPSVYFDNWAFMDIVEDNLIAERFTRTLKSRNGTLEFSFMNLLEFSEINDSSQINKIELFLESVMPNLCFIDVIPNRVIDREDKILRKQLKDPPHWNKELLNFFATMKRQSLNPLSIKGLLSDLRDPKIIIKCKTFMLDLVESFERLRKKSKSDPKYRAEISVVTRGVILERATRYIYRDSVNSIIRDNINLSNSNHWRDLFHMIVPIAYCDFVLLDKMWADRARKTITRLRHIGQTAEMARVFSKKDLNNFWKIFEEEGQ